MEYFPERIVRTPTGMVHIEDIAPITGHPYFERQKRIKQTGIVYTVFPYATHTRYGHAIDTVQMTRDVATKSLSVGRNLSKEQLAILVALAALHDISHGPYSHQSEFVLQQHTGMSHTDLFMDTVSKHFKRNVEQCGFSLDELETVYSSPAFELIDAVHGTDKLSYVRADARQIFGEQVDLEPLMTWAFYSDATGFCINEKGVPALRSYLEKWYQMHNDAYWQKAVLSNTTLLLRAMNMILRDNTVSIRELMEMTDDECDRAILSHPEAAKLIQRIFAGPQHWYKPLITFKIEGHEMGEIKEREKGIKIVTVSQTVSSRLSEVGNHVQLDEIEEELFDRFKAQMFISTTPQPQRVVAKNPKVFSSERGVSFLRDYDQSFFHSLENKGEDMWVARVIVPPEDRRESSLFAEKVATLILDRIK